jgi:hypothetical protein
MALTFAKKKPAAAAETAPPKQALSPSPSSNTKAAPTSGGLGFLKKGKAAQAALASEEAKADMQAASQGKLWRFWMPEDEERQVTFLDGGLDEEGMLDINMFYEHSLKVNGRWEQFVCTAESEGHCPICDKGDSKPYLAGVFTVIDHSQHKIKSGANAGKIISNSKKLYVAKKQTIKLLTKQALKRGGLAGCTFDITRGDDKTASVGSQFEFVSKMSPQELMAKYGVDEATVTPADYEKEITYRAAAELIELGIGKAPGGVGYEKGVTDKKQLASEL